MCSLIDAFSVTIPDNAPVYISTKGRGEIGVELRNPYRADIRQYVRRARTPCQSHRSKSVNFVKFSQAFEVSGGDTKLGRDRKISLPIFASDFRRDQKEGFVSRLSRPTLGGARKGFLSRLSRPISWGPEGGISLPSLASDFRRSQKEGFLSGLSRPTFGGVRRRDFAPNFRVRLSGQWC